jgi:hypothetical protein
MSNEQKSSDIIWDKRKSCSNYSQFSQYSRYKLKYIWIIFLKKLKLIHLELTLVVWNLKFSIFTLDLSCIAHSPYAL